MRKPGPWFLAGFGAVLAGRLWAAGIASGHDFEVYWRAARAWLAGISPYAYGPENHGLVFKYPPWILPVFIPFGFFSESVAKAAWAGLELVCLGFSFRVLHREGVRASVLLASGAGFWWIWLGHFYAGQITLILLASALASGLASMRAAKRGKDPAWPLALALVLWTAKVFSLVAFAGEWSRARRPRVLAAAFFLVFSLYAVALSRLPAGGLFSGWIRGALSGGQELPEVVRGPANHGFPALLLRIFAIPAENSRADLLAFAVVATGLGALWWRASRALPHFERFSGWLALAVVAHPLAWHHSFVLAFPLSAFALERSTDSRRRGLIALSALGIACIGLILPQTFGSAAVRPLELAGLKSWGAVLCAIALIRASRYTRVE